MLQAPNTYSSALCLPSVEDLSNVSYRKVKKSRERAYEKEREWRNKDKLLGKSSLRLQDVERGIKIGLPQNRLPFLKYISCT